MIVYIDLIFFLNFMFDTLLLLSVNIALKRNIYLRKILLGGLIGSISIFFLFLKLNNLELFLFKIIISILMILFSFGFKNFITNLINLYLISIVLGGFLYSLQITFNYHNEGLIFYYDNFNLNFIILILFSPIILYIYIKQMKKNKKQLSKIYEGKLVLNNDKIINLCCFLDTGHKLVDPYFHKNIIIINKSTLNKKMNFKAPILVPFRALNNKGILNCYKAKSLYINKVGVVKDFLIGVSNEDINIPGVNCLINERMIK